MLQTIVEGDALGVGKLTNINVPADGVASASGQGHRVHNGVFTSVYGQLEQIHDWTVIKPIDCCVVVLPDPTELRVARTILLQSLQAICGCIRSMSTDT